MENKAVIQNLLDRLAPTSKEPTSERIWRFSERMTDVYLQQMKRFDEDEESWQWHKRYSVENMPPPDDTRDMAEVAAQMAFYFPTHFFKYQKAATQQLLEWQSKQEHFNPYPFGSPSITMIDIGAGVGAASLALIDMLATWMDITVKLGYTQLGVTIHPIVVDPDRNKQGPRLRMLNNLSRLLDKHMINVEPLTEVFSLYPEPECIQHLINAVSSGSLVICCMSNFLSSVPYGSSTSSSSSATHTSSDVIKQSGNCATIQATKATDDEAKAVQYAKAGKYLLDNISVRNKLLLASEVDEQGKILRSFAHSLHPCLDTLVRRNRVRFYSPQGCYWHSLEDGNESEDLDCAVNFWSVAHWITGTTGLFC